jgi:hypothetical protein
MEREDSEWEVGYDEYSVDMGWKIGFGSENKLERKAIGVAALKSQ